MQDAIFFIEKTALLMFHVMGNSLGLEVEPRWPYGVRSCGIGVANVAGSQTWEIKHFPNFINISHISFDCCHKFVKNVLHESMVSCQKGPTRHAYTWQIGPFWQDTLEMYVSTELQLRETPGSPSGPPSWYAGWSTQILGCLTWKYWKNMYIFINKCPSCLHHLGRGDMDFGNRNSLFASWTSIW